MQDDARKISISKDRDHKSKRRGDDTMELVEHLSDMEKGREDTASLDVHLEKIHLGHNEGLKNDEETQQSTAPTTKDSETILVRGKMWKPDTKNTIERMRDFKKEFSESILACAMPLVREVRKIIPELIRETKLAMCAHFQEENDKLFANLANIFVKVPDFLQGHKCGTLTAEQYKSFAVELALSGIEAARAIHETSEDNEQYLEMHPLQRCGYITGMYTNSFDNRNWINEWNYQNFKATYLGGLKYGTMEEVIEVFLFTISLLGKIELYIDLTNSHQRPP